MKDLYPKEDKKFNNDILSIINNVIAKGNDIEIRKSKDGIKILEVSKKLITEIYKLEGN